MSDYNKVAIDINENGYTVTVADNGKRYVFDKAKKMREWLKDNLAPTGEVKRFSDALDNEPETGPSFDDFNTVFNTPIGTFSNVTSTTAATS